MNPDVSAIPPQEVFDCLGNSENQKYNIWVDGSFLDKDRNKAGLGVIVSKSDDQTPLLAIAYNISSLKIRKSKYTELWAASLALSDLKDLDIDTLVCDSPVTKTRIKNIREGISTKRGFERLTQEIEETPELLDNLQKALIHHPDIHIKHVSRKKENMPHADHFSRYAAKRRLARIFSTANDLDIPCLYKIVNRDGEPRQTYFFDKTENYDVDEYMKGRFQTGIPPEMP